MKILKNLEVPGFPSTLVFADQNTAYLTERLTGIVWRVEEDKFTKIIKLPIFTSISHNEAGLFGLALDPDFENTRYIYAFYTYGESLDNLKSRVICFKEGSDNDETLIENLPAGKIHNGGIIAFGPDGKLYIGVGETAQADKSQDLEFLGGKILRINSDGSIPEDNPFLGSPVYSYGHRNIFGLAFHPYSGKLYISELGPEVNDEINIVEKGGNYGWPKVTGEMNKEKYIDPIVTYSPTITPTQCCFIENNLYFGSYNNGSVHKLTLDPEIPDRVISDEIIYQDKPFGIIGVFADNKQNLYVATPNMIKLI